MSKRIYSDDFYKWLIGHNMSNIETVTDINSMRSWLEKHLSYSKNKRGLYPWEDAVDSDKEYGKTRSMFNDTFKKGYSIPKLVFDPNEFDKDKKIDDAIESLLGSEITKEDSYCLMILKFQHQIGRSFYSYADLDNMDYYALQTFCIEVGLVKKGQKKVIDVEPAMRDVIDKAKQLLKKMTEEDFAYYDAVMASKGEIGKIKKPAKVVEEEEYDHEDFLTMDEYAFGYGIDATEEDLATIEKEGIKIIDALGEEKPDSRLNYELKVKLVGVILEMLSKIKTKKDKKYTREELMNFDIIRLKFIYEAVRVQLNSTQLSMFPTSDEVEVNVRFGK